MNAIPIIAQAVQDATIITMDPRVLTVLRAIEIIIIGIFISAYSLILMARLSSSTFQTLNCLDPEHLHMRASSICENQNSQNIKETVISSFVPSVAHGVVPAVAYEVVPAVVPAVAFGPSVYDSVMRPMLTHGTSL